MTPRTARPPQNTLDTDAWITLCWIRDTRYYRAHLEQDLWSGWVITPVNGRVNSPLGRVRSVPVPTIESALAELAAIAKRRRQRDYTLNACPLKLKEEYADGTDC